MLLALIKVGNNVSDMVIAMRADESTVLNINEEKYFKNIRSRNSLKEVVKCEFKSQCNS